MAYFAVTMEGPLRLHSGLDHGNDYDAPGLLLGEHRWPLARGNEAVYGLAVAGRRVAALYDAGSSWPSGSPSTVAVATLAHMQPSYLEAPSGAYDVAVTDRCVFVRHRDRDVIALRPEPELVARDALRIRGSPSHLAIASPGGVRWLDADGRPVEAELSLPAITALAVDRVDPGWLVCADGGVYYVRGPGDPPRLVASHHEPIGGVARSRDAVYIACGSRIWRIAGDGVVCAVDFDKQQADRGSFDAGPEGAYVCWFRRDRDDVRRLR